MSFCIIFPYIWIIKSVMSLHIFVYLDVNMYWSFFWLQQNQTINTDARCWNRSREGDNYSSKRISDEPPSSPSSYHLWISTPGTATGNMFYIFSMTEYLNLERILSICVYASASVYLCVCLCVCLSVCMPMRLSVYLSESLKATFLIDFYVTWS